MIFDPEPRAGLSPNATRYSDGRVEWSWGKDRVIAVDFFGLYYDQPPPNIGDRRDLYGYNVRVIAENWMGQFWYVVPDDWRAPFDVLYWRMMRFLFRAEIKVIHWLKRRGWIATKEMEVFQWRDALPFALMRWH